MNHRWRTMRSVATFGAVLGLTAVLAACGDTSSRPDATEPSMPASGSTPSTGDVPAVDELTATACTWRWFDRYDVQVAVPDDVPEGTEVGVQLTVILGDVGSVGGEVKLVTDGSRAQTVEVRSSTPLSTGDPNDLTIYRDDVLAPGAGALCDVSFDGDRSGTFGDVELQYDVDAPASDGSAFGDLIAVDSHDAAAFPLAELMFLQPDALFDRLYLAPELQLQGIAIQRDGTCRTVRSWYPAGDSQVSVEQRHGCLDRSGEEMMPGWSSAEVDDPNWRVTLVGPAAEVPAVLDALQWIDVPGGEAAEGDPVPGADAYIDGYLEDHDGVVELGRFDFHDGKVAIVDRAGEGSAPFERYMEPVVSAAGVNYAATTVTCEEYTIGIASSVGTFPTSAEPGGYAYFIARDAGTTFTLMVPGLPPTVVPEPTASGVYLAFLDIGTSGLPIPQVVVTDANGAPVPCTQ
jgi:hypothetical protein